MADYCKQCSIEINGKDNRELADITTKEMVAENTYYVVICEGCGPVQVDPEGACINDDCYVDHVTGNPRVKS